MVTALFQENTTNGVRCKLCPHGCVMREGDDGKCRVRGVRSGRLIALGYGNISSAHMDPIKKKPLYHFHPGSMILSIGGWGCNLSCKFCQNWTISQQFIDEKAAVASSEDIAIKALENGSIGVAYTYNEPIVGYEFIKDCCMSVRANGLKNVLVTNGYINIKPAADILPMIDALNIDIKSMDNDFYRKYCGGSLQPVLDFAVQAVSAGCHVEITNLVIPGLNDSDGNFETLAEWICQNLGAQVPLHLSAYHPEYKISVLGTSVESLVNARTICAKRLDNVHLGNVPLRFL